MIYSLNPDNGNAFAVQYQLIGNRNINRTEIEFFFSYYADPKAVYLNSSIGSLAVLTANRGLIVLEDADIIVRNENGEIEVMRIQDVAERYHSSKPICIHGKGFCCMPKPCDQVCPHRIWQS